jgi:hypothetical protein
MCHLQLKQACMGDAYPVLLGTVQVARRDCPEAQQIVSALGLLGLECKEHTLPDDGQVGAGDIGGPSMLCSTCGSRLLHTCCCLASIQGWAAYLQLQVVVVDSEGERDGEVEQEDSTVQEESGGMSLPPCLYIGGKLVGDLSDLKSALNHGTLLTLLQGVGLSPKASCASVVGASPGEQESWTAV